MAVADAVEEQVDGGVERQQDVRDDGEAVHPQRPGVNNVAVGQGLRSKVSEIIRFVPKATMRCSRTKAMMCNVISCTAAL